MLFLLSAAAVFAEHPVKIGSDQTGQSRFSGAIEQFGFSETLTVDAIKRFAETKPDDKKIKKPTALPQTIADRGKQYGAAQGWIYLDDKNNGNCRIFDQITPGGSDGWLLDLYPGRKLRLIDRNDTLV
ncbi:MAG: hypothetical protein LBS59_07065, partial [Puniceicoccales bacterium]|nr:hypothetical protein [Puniceicoccales bacterium]